MQAELPLAEAHIWGRLLLARWLRGDALRALGQRQAAQTLLESTLRDSELWVVPQVAQRCHTSLGMLAASVGDTEGAEAACPATDLSPAFAAGSAPVAAFATCGGCRGRRSMLRAWSAISAAAGGKSRAIMRAGPSNCAGSLALAAPLGPGPCIRAIPAINATNAAADRNAKRSVFARPNSFASDDRPRLCIQPPKSRMHSSARRNWSSSTHR